MRKLLNSLLIATTAFGLVAAGAMADDDRDDDDRRRISSHNFRHSPKCQILTVEVTAELKLIIEGRGLTKRNRIPTVSFGGNPVTVDPATLTAERIEADLSSVELAATPKDYLLEVQRSRRDFFGCPRHMVTVVPAPKANKIVFVTSTETAGDFSAQGGGLTAGDAICNTLASTAGLSGTFVAYLSDESENAFDRLPVDGGPWFNTKGDPVVASRDAIITESPEGSFLENAVQYDETGTDRNGALVWTGTTEFGELAFSHCSSWTSQTGQGTPGLANQIDLQWVTGEGFPCDQPARLYCFQN